MKKFTILTVLSLCLMTALPQVSFSQTIEGTYEALTSKKITLEIKEVPGTKRLTATIKGVVIRDGGRINPIKLKGKYKLIKQGTQGEEFHLITFQGFGKWIDSSKNKFPIIG